MGRRSKRLSTTVRLSRVALFAFGSIFTVSAASAAMLADEPVSDSEARGTTPESQKGYDISARSDRTDSGFADSKVDATMVLRNKAGQETSRQFSFSTLEKESEAVGDKSLVVFSSPRDVEGTALLSHAEILKPDQQWLYLPALKRVKRISSANKSGAFIGSEFAFEDFTITELNKFTYAYLQEETVDGVVMDVIERFPRYEKSGYTRQKVWIDQDIFQTRKVEFYDRKGDLLKTLSLNDYRQYGEIWRAQSLSMVNHQTGKETDLIYGDFQFETGLDANDFEQAILTRLR
ncbi:MAG: outer membrane lipoprotein-sorting protein [Pseudomonadota bacterium]